MQHAHHSIVRSNRQRPSLIAKLEQGLLLYLLGDHGLANGQDQAKTPSVDGVQCSHKLLSTGKQNW